MTPRVDDILRLRPGAALLQQEPAPGWVAGGLAGAPWVVVRRGEIRNDVIPVRVRGGTSGLRFDSLVSLSAIADRSTPEELAGRRCDPYRTAQVPALLALARVHPVLTRRGHSWGPIGSIGFELATNLPAATPASDLDLVLRLEEPLGAAQARRLLRDLVEAAAPVRIDVLVEMPLGAVNLGDLALRPDRVLMKTTSGIRVISDPLREAA